MSPNDPRPANGTGPTVASLFYDRVAKNPDSEAFRHLENDRWVSLTWRQTAERVEQLAAGLLALGIAPEERIGIASGTRLEWVLADLAVMCAGAATTTVYPSTHAADTAYILADSESRIVFAEDDSQLEKLRAHRRDLPRVDKVVLFEGSGDGNWVITLDELADLGAKHLTENSSAVQSTVQEIGSDQLATLIYTSGTTGKPKGVRLTHEAWVYEGEFIRSEGILNESDLQLLWLPLAHSFGKVLLAAQLSCGFVSAIDPRVDKIVGNCAAVQPTFMAAVPRIFEKAYGRVVTTQQSKGGLSEKLFERAVAVGLDVSRRQRAGQSVPPHLAVQHKLFDRLVFSKVRQVFGGRIRYFVSGAAPMNREIAEWFHAAGLLILEGYGLTETAGGAFINRPDNFKLGTVGPPFNGTAVRIADDGEVQINGPSVMEGYHHLPDKTQEAFTDDGWLRTGDRGALDDDGFLTITGRIKELFKTSGGKYVAPPAISAQFMAMCPYASQFLVFGEARQYCVALITLDPDAIMSWAKERGLDATSYEELTKHPDVHSMIEEYVGKLNADLNRWETIKKWRILEQDLSVDSGELTPSLKVKRSVVEENNREVISAFYNV